MRAKLFLGALTLYLTLAVPLLLTLGSVRLVMTPLFLQLEYHRPGFPADRYGFTLQDRLTYAPYAVDYLLNDAGIDDLGDLTFADGAPLFTERELSHMVDVKVVTRAAYNVLLVGLAVTGGIILAMRRTPAGLAALRQGLLNGALLTLGLIALIVLGAIIAWDVFFTGFHQLFFADGTWIFLYSDTLIRLFPEQFWFDAALTIGGLTVGGAALIAGLAWRATRRDTPSASAAARVFSSESGL
jgi:integral membrane protein (TIGR01906 family)